VKKRIQIFQYSDCNSYIVIVNVIIKAEIISNPNKINVTIKIAVADIAKFIKASCQIVKYCS
jgi:hypothetical protein